MIRQRQSSPNVVDVKRRPIFEHAFTAKNPYVEIAEENITNLRKKMSINPYIV